MKKLTMVFIILLFCLWGTSSMAAWFVYEQAEKGAPFTKLFNLEKHEHISSQVKASCIVHLYGGNYAVKIKDAETDREEVFLCDDVNLAEEKKTQKEKQAHKANEEQKEHIKLW